VSASNDTKSEMRPTFEYAPRYACVGATARRTRVSLASARAQETGRLLPLKALLVAETIPLSFSYDKAVKRLPHIRSIFCCLARKDRNSLF
jgi:hypothetical protein